MTSVSLHPKSCHRRKSINYGSHQIIVCNPACWGGGGGGLGGVPAAGGLGGVPAAGGLGGLPAASGQGGLPAAVGGGGGGAPTAGGGAAAGGVPLGGNPINNSLFAAEVQRQAPEAACRQQEQAPSGH